MLRKAQPRGGAESRRAGFARERTIPLLATLEKTGCAAFVSQLFSRGIMRLGGVQTKHYFQEDLYELIAGLQMKPIIVEQVEYPWSTEFDRPPRWMSGLHPCSWLVLGRKAAHAAFRPRGTRRITYTPRPDLR